MGAEGRFVPGLATRVSPRTGPVTNRLRPLALTCTVSRECPRRSRNDIDRWDTDVGAVAPGRCPGTHGALSAASAALGYQPISKGWRPSVPRIDRAFERGPGWTWSMSLFPLLQV
jgi:hypothetical protein